MIEIQQHVRYVGLKKLAKKLKRSPSFVSRVLHGRAKSAPLLKKLKRMGVINEIAKK